MCPAYNKKTMITSGNIAFHYNCITLVWHSRGGKLKKGNIVKKKGGKSIMTPTYMNNFFEEKPLKLFSYIVKTMLWCEFLV